MDIRKEWNWIILVILVVAGVWLRVYHLDYPVVGYHNWKETHYLTEARNFAEDGFFVHGFFIPEYDYFQGSEGMQGEHADSFPLTSILVAIAFKVVGFSLALARSLSVVFSVATIIVMYCVVRKLFNREDIALLASALTAGMPLLVFFGRQVQLEPYALFLMLLSAYFYLEWLEKHRMRDLFLSAVLVVIGFLCRYDHFTILFAFAFVFPYRVLLDRKVVGKILLALSPGVLVPMWLLYNKWYGQSIGSSLVPEGVDVSLLFSPEWQQAVWAHIRDNYTLFGFYVALVGFLLLCVLWWQNRGNRAYSFVLGFSVGIIPWVIVATSYLAGHAYHQYPAVAVVILLQSLAIVIAAIYLGKLVKLPGVRAAFIVGVVLVMFYGVGSIEGFQSSTSRLFDTQFVGLDIAGRYIHDHSVRGDSIMHTSGQGYGLMWHADRKGYKLPSDPARIMDLEAKGAKWIFMYNWGFNKFQEENFTAYLSKNYGLRQVAFTQDGVGSVPIYFLFERGGAFNLSDINDFVQAHQVASQEYETSRGKISVTYTV